MTKFLFATALALTIAGPALAYDGEDLASKAAISIDQAQAIALKARPGEVKGKELEAEKGGSGLRYSFDITAENIEYEVGVDAANGAVLENAAESGKPD